MIYSMMSKKKFRIKIELFDKFDIVLNYLSRWFDDL